MNTISKHTKENNAAKLQIVIALILCIPSDNASYLFKDYENFFDSSKF